MDLLLVFFLFFFFAAAPEPGAAAAALAGAVAGAAAGAGLGAGGSEPAVYTVPLALMGLTCDAVASMCGFPAPVCAILSF